MRIIFPVKDMVHNKSIERPMKIFVGYLDNIKHFHCNNIIIDYFVKHIGQLSFNPHKSPDSSYFYY